MGVTFLKILLIKLPSKTWMQKYKPLQGRNHRENLVVTSAMVGRICLPPGGNRVKVSENLGGTMVVPVARVAT